MGTATIPKMKDVQVVAHRGLTSSYPENSLGAVNAALVAGLRYIEVDIRASSDGELFLLHDPWLDRTTNGAGRLGKLTGSEAASIQLADGSPLPRLEDVLRVVSGRAVLCLDIKEARSCGELIRLLKRSTTDVEVWCEQLAVVERAASAGFSATAASSGLLPQGLGGFLWTARDAGASAVSFYPADLTRDVAAGCRNAGMPFLCGTPNDVPTWRYLARAGARALITDRPLACLHAFGLRPALGIN
jgi:glycerophosphoryl diester phosphodiesterase